MLNIIVILLQQFVHKLVCRYFLEVTLNNIMHLFQSDASVYEIETIMFIEHKYMLKLKGIAFTQIIRLQGVAPT